MPNVHCETVDSLAEKLPYIEKEVFFQFIRSGGPGGQGVNTSNSQAELHWLVGASKVFSEEEKMLIRESAGKRLNAEDEIIIKNKTERQQLRNKRKALEELWAMITESLKPKIERKATKPTFGAIERRVSDKKVQAKKKKDRKSNFEE